MHIYSNCEHMFVGSRSIFLSARANLALGLPYREQVVTNTRGVVLLVL